VSRGYIKGESVCRGTCGQKLRPSKAAPGEYPGTIVRHAKGMCWPCYRDHDHVERRPSLSARERAVQIELDAYLAYRRRRGIPAQGIQLREAS
jgi:hypothetical protein